MEGLLARGPRQGIGAPRRCRGGWTRPRPHASVAASPRHSPKHSAVRRMPTPAPPWHRPCRRWRAGWTWRKPHVFRGGVMRLLVQKGVAIAPAGGPWDDPTLMPGLLRYLDPARANALTRELVMGIVSRNVNETSLLGFNGLAILDDISTAEISRRAGLMTMTIGQAASGQFAWAGALAAKPFPCRLTTQELVELLKMPTCFGTARRVVLDRLGNRYGRRFINHWAFVRFAREQGLDLDLTTPPKRPDPRNRSSACSKSWTGRMQTNRRSVSLVVVLRDDLLGGDLSPGLESRARNTGGPKRFGDGAFKSLQLGEGQEETMDIGQVGDSLGGSGSTDHTNHLLPDEVHGRDHQNLLDDLVSGEAFDSPNIHEVTVLRLANLIQAVAETIRHGSNPDSYLKASAKGTLATPRPAPPPWERGCRHPGSSAVHQRTRSPRVRQRARRRSARAGTPARRRGSSPAARVHA